MMPLHIRDLTNVPGAHLDSDFTIACGLLGRRIDGRYALIRVRGAYLPRLSKKSNHCTMNLRHQRKGVARWPPMFNRTAPCSRLQYGTVHWPCIFLMQGGRTPGVASYNPSRLLSSHVRCSRSASHCCRHSTCVRGLTES
jgi:hypothetical protein